MKTSARSISAYQPHPTDPIIGETIRWLPGDWTWRPGGTPDWLFMLMIRGKGLIEINPGEYLNLNPGSFVVVEAGTTHNFGADGEMCEWWWCHAVEQPTWREWIHWQKINHGVHLAVLDRNPYWCVIRAAMKDLLVALRTPSPVRIPMAYNALDRVVLLTSAATTGQYATVDSRIAKAIALLSSDTPPRPSELAAQCGLSYDHLAHLFQAEMGSSIGNYREHILIERAKARLLATNDSIKTIAYDLGFSCQFYFSRRFRLREGTSPAQYRRQHGVA